MYDGAEVLVEPKTRNVSAGRDRLAGSRTNPLGLHTPNRLGTPLALARILRAAHQMSLELEPGAVHWPALVSTACDAWLGGLVLQVVDRQGWALAPAQMQQLRWQAIQIDRNNARMMRHLAHIARTLAHHDVDVMPLKGAALNLTLYDQLHLRPMSDIDALVRPAAAMRAVAVLESSGYRCGPGLVRGDFFPRFHYEVELLSNEADPVRIDLHARPFRPLRYAQTVPDEAFWQASRVLDTHGAHVRVACDEEQLIHLATHSACHGHARLLWLYDILRLVDLRGRDLDWDRVIDASRRWRLTLPVREALGAVERVWGAVLPEHVRMALRQARVNWRDRLCLDQAPHDATSPVRHVAVNVLCTRGARFRLGYLMRMMLPDRGHMAQIYCGRHFGWLFWAHVRRLLRAIARPLHLA
jgi:hypothetical protein